jgi:hypothetical protein
VAVRSDKRAVWLVAYLLTPASRGDLSCRKEMCSNHKTKGTKQWSVNPQRRSAKKSPQYAALSICRAASRQSADGS